MPYRLCVAGPRMGLDKKTVVGVNPGLVKGVTTPGSRLCTTRVSGGMLCTAPGTPEGWVYRVEMHPPL